MNGIFSGFVVANTKRLRGGGSSSVFSSALKAARREHVHLVDDEDAVLAGRGGVADGLDQLAHVVDAGAARGVDLLHVGRGAARRSRGTAAHSPQGVVRRALLAVQAAREDAREGGLADAARARQQDRVGHARRADRVAQRRRDVRLARHLVEALRAATCARVPGSSPGRPPAGRTAVAAAAAASRDRRAPPLATETPLPLLPSGSDGVHEVRDRAGPCDRGSPQGRPYPKAEHSGPSLPTHGLPGKRRAGVGFSRDQVPGSGARCQ